MSKAQKVILDCGITVEQWTHRQFDWIEADITGLYEGGDVNLLAMSQLFLQMHEQGYQADGISIVNGYYDSIEGMSLRFVKPKK